jgi:hypothetical protein
MSRTLALLASLTLALPAGAQQDPVDWRARVAALEAAGDDAGALAAAEQARSLDNGDPWTRYTWVRALARVDPVAARAALPGLQDPSRLQRLTTDERAELASALAYLCLDLNVDHLAAEHFAEVPEGTPAYARAQAGLAILAVRRGDSRQALVHFAAARVAGPLDAALAELERETRFQAALQQFLTARDLRDANGAARALGTLDELRPLHPATLRARADLAGLRGDAAARERALRELLRVDPAAPGAASQLVDTLLEQRRPAEALAVARELARDRLALDLRLQAYERNWVPHLEAALAWRQRDAHPGHRRLEAPGLQLAFAGSHDRWGRFRLAADALRAQSGTVAADQAWGSSPGLLTPLRVNTDDGIGWLAQWAPRSGLVLELGHSPHSFTVDNAYGALRLDFEVDDYPFSLGLERMPVGDSLLSLAGATDPLSGRDWGGVVRDRAYLRGGFGGDAFSVHGGFAGARLDGRNVDDNSQWQADVGFWWRAASGQNWRMHVGGNVDATGFADNLSRFTLGHGGYFSPRRFLAIGPTFGLQGGGSATSFRLEGGVNWQFLSEETVEYFPTDATLQAASGDPHYHGSSRDGPGARLAATVEWRISANAVTGLRLEGSAGEDFDEVRLQVYTRRWSGAVTEPLRRPPAAVLPARFDEMF